MWGRSGRRWQHNFTCGAGFVLAIACAAGEWRDTSPHAVREIDTARAKFRYLDWGGSGPLAVFLPGHGQTPHIFDRLAPQFTDTAHVVGVFRRGCCGTEAHTGGYDTISLAEDLRSFLGGLHARTAILIAFSMGGAEATALAAREPDRVSGIMYLESAYDYSGMPSGSRDPISMAPSDEESKSIEAGRRWFRRINGFWADPVEADARAANLQADGTVRMNPYPEGVGEALWKGMIEYHPEWARVGCPVAAIFAVSATHPFVRPGMEPALVRRANAYWRREWYPYREEAVRRFRSAFPGAEVTILSDTKHLCFLRPEDERRVSAPIRRFLRML